MITVTLNGLAIRKLRAALTAIAIVVGVAMISGTYVMMDTTLHAFDTVFQTAYSKADAIVVGKNPIVGGHNNASVPPVSASIVARIRALAQVKYAQGFIDDKAEIRNAQGGAITGPGAPLAFGVPGRGSPLDTLTVVTGHLPTGPGQIALDEQTSSTNHLRPGSTVGIVSRHPLQFFRVVGLVRFGGVGSLGPIQLLVFDLPVAQQLFDKQGYFDEINVAARPGVSAQQIVRAITPLLPPSAEVKSSTHRSRQPPTTWTRAWRSSATYCSRSAGSRCSSDRS
jgi:putative ABC transport system permease protein